jgi:hypothetical protein
MAPNLGLTGATGSGKLFAPRITNGDVTMSDFPRTLEAVKNDAKIMGAYLAYAKRRLCLNEVLFYFDKGNAEGIYPKYLDPNAKSGANVSSAVTAPAEKLAAAKDWRNAAWNKIIADGKAEVADALNSDLLQFKTSNEYTDYLKKEKMGSPQKAAKLLGISDTKKLTQAMEALAVGDRKAATKVLEGIMKEEKLKGKAEELIKALEKSGLA